MSGADRERKRRRKRRTRAERNQMSQHHLLQMEKQKQKKSANKSNMEPTQNSSYTLRSSKGTSQTSLMLKDFKKATAGTITQGRLTRGLGILNFTNAKSSEWMRRGPIPETEAVKKKVENDMKRILNLAEKDTLSNSGDLGSGMDACTKSTEPAHNVELDAMEIDPPVASLSPVSKKSTHISQRVEETDSKAASKAATIQTPSSSLIKAAVSKSGNSVASLSTSSNTCDENLEPEPPVLDIADKILKELKPKFNKMFPGRDIEMEVGSDLQKLLRQSSAFVGDPELGFRLGPDMSYPDTLTLSTPIPRSPALVTSSLSACRPQVKSEAGHSYLSQLQHLDTVFRPDVNTSCTIQEHTFYQLEDELDSFDFGRDRMASPLFSTAFMMTDAQETEPFIRIKLNVEDSEDDENENDNDILSAVRVNAFLASARELEAEQQRLKQLNRFSSYGEASPSRINGYHFLDCRHTIQNSSGQTDDDATSCSSREQPKSSSQLSDWKNTRSARMLDFSEPTGDQMHRTTSFSCPTRIMNKNRHSNHHHYQNNSKHVCSQAGCCRTSSPQMSCAYDLRKSGRLGIINKDGPVSCSQPFPTSSGHTEARRNAAMIGSCLAQSRLNFQTALSSACRLSGLQHTKAAEPMDWEVTDGFSSFSQSRGPYTRSSSPLGSQHLMSHSLSELQTHQADLQKQARDFLDDLDRSSVRSQSVHVGRQPARHRRHLFQMASPASNGSPVWMPLVLKDTGIKTGSLV